MFEEAATQLDSITWLAGELFQLHFHLGVHFLLLLMIGVSYELCVHSINLARGATNFFFSKLEI